MIIYLSDNHRYATDSYCYLLRIDFDAILDYLGLLKSIFD